MPIVKDRDPGDENKSVYVWNGKHWNRFGSASDRNIRAMLSNVDSNRIFYGYDYPDGPPAPERPKEAPVEVPDIFKKAFS